ncbi:MAG TPA: glycoside hydrolase family 2 TIM barrel-domain containing protein [Candidatus Paceibacterota bacterium]|nr:glycoside hydrolase family 2 TIM barrel-domain containing protein [Candidatus Paceibacterota bacterium]
MKKHLPYRIAQALGLGVACALIMPLSIIVKADRISLAGSWRFELDRNNRGLEERWFERQLSGRFKLPGCLSAQGIGEPVSVDTQWTGGIVDRSWFTDPRYEEYRQPGHVKVPFWLQPELYYAGAAWYQRKIEIPAAWHGQRIVLRLERPHWETQVWLDSRILGTNTSLSTPHMYDLGTVIRPGCHVLTVRVDNRMVIDIGENSHSISDHTQGNWNGIVGRIELETTPPIWVDDIQVYPDIKRRSAQIRVSVGNASGSSGQILANLTLSPVSQNESKITPVPLVEQRISAACDPTGAFFAAELPLTENVQQWDEFTPVLYRATVALDPGGDSRSVLFGMREIATQGTQFIVNGRKTFIRGTLECAIFPKTGHPPVDADSWKKVIRAAKAHGLNNLRFHSWCPPDAAFAAADELGFYLHVECGSWANQSTSLGDGLPVDAWIYQEADRILRAYGNHPSFVFLLYGNEPGGNRHEAFLKEWVSHYRARDSRRLYSSGAGWPQIPENQFHVAPDPRIQGWGQGLKSRINAYPPETTTDYRDYIRTRPVPVISHEIGQWCVYPNFKEIPKYTGYLKPRNFEIFRDTLKAHNMWSQAREFLLASGKLQTLCYKEEIESALRTPGMGGFQLLDLHDFPGQGTALVGVLDPFWEEKGYVKPEEYRRFCNTTVPLARLSKRIFTSEEILTADLEVAHFGDAPLTEMIVYWKLINDTGRALASDQRPVRHIPVDNAVSLGNVRIDLRSLPVPAGYQLVVGLAQASPPAQSGKSRSAIRAPSPNWENDWDIWVYPKNPQVSIPPKLTIAHSLDATALTSLEAGGKVLLLLPPSRVASIGMKPIALGFSSIFWNTAWTGRQPPHTLGILCNPSHPLLSEFPTDFHSNWQWWYLLSQSGVMCLDTLPKDIRPTVQVIDDWFTARRLGLVFEAKLGKGSLLVCSIDLDNQSSPVVSQFRRSLLNYLSDSKFHPRMQVTPDQVRALYTRTP